MNFIKISIVLLAFLFLAITNFIDLPKNIYNAIQGIMALFAIVFVFLRREEMGINDMFSKKNKEDK